jgi:hypothetical protein
MASVRAIEGFENRLRDSAAKMASLERHLAAERKRRDLLCLKLTTVGRSTRQIARVAGITSPAVTGANRRARKEHAARQERERG